MSAFPAGLCFMDDFLLPNATGSRREVFLSPYDPYSGWLSQYFMGKTSPQEPFSFQVFVVCSGGAFGTFAKPHCEAGCVGGVLAGQGLWGFFISPVR